jgi:hypothetical protein
VRHWNESFLPPHRIGEEFDAKIAHYVGIAQLHDVPNFGDMLLAERASNPALGIGGISDLDSGIAGLRSKSLIARKNV